MPGGRLRSFRLGDRAELLVGHLLAGVAFTTPVPRQEDIGVDFMCSLIRSDDENAGFLKAGPIFFVQSKSSAEDWVFEKPHELEWIKNQENPILLCNTSGGLLFLARRFSTQPWSLNDLAWLVLQPVR
jgi:hypothetical protein